jgi:hypothetical protein
MGKIMTTPIGRISFPHLDKPDQFGKYSATLLLKKGDKHNDEFVNNLWTIASTVCKDAHGEANVAKGMQHFTLLRDGDKKENFESWRAEFAGHYVILLRRKPEYGKICCVNRQKQPIDASEIYAGCDVSVCLDVYPYTYSGKKSVSISFMHVMKVGDNEPFVSHGIDAETAFDALDISNYESAQPAGLGAGIEKTTTVPAAQPAGLGNPFSKV